MDNNVVIEQVVALFLIIIIGVYARKQNIITGETIKKLSELLLKITLPLLIISSFQFDYSRDMLQNAMLVLLFAFGVHILSMLIGKFLYYKYPQRLRSVLKFITVFSNCGFMGFPILDSMFGSIGIFYGSIFFIPFNIFLWTYGVVVFKGDGEKQTYKKLLINPGIIAVILGMILFLFSIKLPVPIYTAVSMVGSMTTPISMLIVGSLLAGVRLKEMFLGFAVYYGTSVRLIVIPLITLFIMRLFPVPDDVLYIIVVLTAMPAAANTAIFAEKYGGDASFASRCIGISTILSVVTIPLIIVFL